jgi:hypothetical protein
MSSKANEILSALVQFGLLKVKGDNSAIEKTGVESAIGIAPKTLDVLLFSPIAGEASTVLQETISNVQHLITGFLCPADGILNEIHAVLQGNTGTGVARNVRVTVAIAEPAETISGLKIGKILHDVLVPVADNVNGDVTLLSGLNLRVPKQFIVCLKGAMQAGTGAIKIQACSSGGPIPGVVGSGGATPVTAATYIYFANPADFDATTPASIVPGSAIETTGYKALSVYIKWRAS